RLLPVPGPVEAGSAALGPGRQRRQQGLLLARAREERAGAAVAPLPGAAGLHPLRRLHRDAEPVLRGAREVEGPGSAAALRKAGRALTAEQDEPTVELAGEPANGTV